MRGPNQAGTGGEGARERVLRRLTLLMGTRLAVVAATLVLALWVVGVGPVEAHAAVQGLYATVACAFGVTALSAALRDRVRRPERLGAFQVAVDVALITALVHFSGGSDSIFGFLYVPITVYAALLFGRRGAYGATSLSAAAYGGMLFATAEGWIQSFEFSAPAPPVRFALWGVYTGALLLVALLASALSKDLDRTGRALDERTEALGRLRELHNRTVDSLTSGLLTTDSSGRITSFNPEAERITKVPAEDALNRFLDEVIPGAKQLAIARRQSAGEEMRQRARLPYRNRAGEDRHLGLAGSILRGEDGSPAGHVVIFQDVTQVVRMERDLRRQERLAAAGQLAADLAHEIRNPLAAISGSIQMLHGSLGRGSESEETGRLMGIVLRETDRLNDLIGDFLRYARPAPPRRQSVKVATLVEEVLKVFESVRPETVTVAVEVPAGLCVLADEGQLRQLLWNLLLNAVQAMPEGGALRIAAGARLPQDESQSGRREAGDDAGWAEIVVSDTGAGIPDEVLDRIFDPFYTTKPAGSGLGLATVHRIVEAHGGRLRVDSSIGRGTAFSLELPRPEETA